MDPIIRSAAVTALRRPLGRPGSPAAPVPAVAPVAAPDEVRPDLPETVEQAGARLRAESEAALQRARAVLDDAEARRRDWEAQEVAARAQLDARQDALERQQRALEQGEETLAAERRQHQASLAESHDAARRRGHAEGLAAGAAEGRAGADAAAGARLAQLADIAAGFAAAADAALARHEDMLVDVAWTAIARMAGELAASREGALAMVRSAVAQLRDAQSLCVRMHPDDAAWLAGHGAAHGWTLQPDPGVTLGGCIVDGAHGSLDARLELQLERLGAALRAARAERPAAPGAT